MKKLIEKASVITGKKCKNEESAKKNLIKFLESNDIDGMEDEDLETLIEIAESFAPEVKDMETEEAEDETAEAEGLAAEAEEDEDGEDEEEEAEEEEQDLDSMSREEMKQFIKENELPIKVKKSMSDDELREEIRGFIEQEEPEPEPIPSKKKAEKAPAAKAEKKRVLSPKTEKKDAELLRKAMGALFNEKEYEYNFIVSGVTVKYKGNNMTRGILQVENCSVLPDGEIKCNAYFNIFKSNDNIMEKTGEDFEKAWNGTPMLRGITVNDALDIVKGVLKDVLGTLSKKDDKLGKNREKMEKELAKKAAPSAKSENKKAAEKKNEQKNAEKTVANEKTSKKETTKKEDVKKAAPAAKKNAKKK